MNVFSLHQEISDALRSSSDAVANELESPLLFAHIRTVGKNEDLNRGFRLTHINPTNRNHERAFDRHIQSFGREALFLDWLTAFFRTRLGTPASKSGPYSITRLHVTIADMESLIKLLDDKLEIATRLVEELLPKSLRMEYQDELYSDQWKPQSNGRTRLIIERLKACRCAAHQLFEQGSSTCRQLLQECASHLSASNDPNDEHSPELEWRFISALQTALLFVAIGNGLNRGFTSVGASYHGENQEPLDSPPLVVVSGIHATDAELQFSKAIKETVIEGTLRDIASRMDDRELGIEPIAIPEKCWGRDDLRTLLVERISKEESTAFASEYFPRFRSSLLRWMCLWAERLRGAVHEGLPLNFTFVVCDLTEIRDSGLFDIFDLDLNGSHPLLPYNARGKTTLGTLESCLQLGLKVVEKKNYAWFLDGKFALAWNSVFPSDRPAALIRIRDGSWRVFQSQLRSGSAGRHHQFIRGCVFLDSDGSGGLSFADKISASFRRGGVWRMNSQELFETVAAHLKNALADWELSETNRSTLLDRICRAIHMISEDPHAGCMIVVVKNGTPPPFEHMGESWRTKMGNDPTTMNLDVLTALMAMDGATILSCQDSTPRVEFRRHVTPKGKRATGLSDAAKQHLDGAGSRRWSAAKAAEREEINLIISVSQDGPIHAYLRNKQRKVDVKPLGIKTVEDQLD